MNIIVDTSVWSLVLRRAEPPVDPQAIRLAKLIKQGQPILLLGVILQELLSGIKRETDFEMVKSHLEPFPILELQRDDYVSAAKLRNLCKANGVQASTIDFQIAATCIEHDCALLTCDNDFTHIAKHCPLVFV